MSTINSKPYLATTTPKGGEKKQTINSVPYLVELEGGGGAGFEARIVDELPETGENGVMYLVANGGAAGNTYDEFLWIESEEKFEKVGTTEVVPPEVVQTIGTSTTDVMSQNATSNLIYPNPSSLTEINIGGSTNIGTSTYYTQIGAQAQVYGSSDSMAIGRAAKAWGNRNVSIGHSAANQNIGNTGSTLVGYDTSIGNYNYSLALGSGAGRLINAKGMADISTGSSGTNGYNSTNYRLLTGLHDPVNDHDAANKEYVDANAGAEINSTDWSALWQ